MPKLFMSYRRTDTASVSGRIYDRLAGRIGRENIFKDVDDIPAGARFAEYIKNSLQECVVELVIIGRDWLTAKSENGGRRLDDPRDWVRLEIEQGFALGLTLIPVLVEGAGLPAAETLPESLREIIEVQAVEIRNDPDFSRDMDRLVAGVERVFAAQTPPSEEEMPPSGPTASPPTPADSGSAITSPALGGMLKAPAPEVAPEADHGNLPSSAGGTIAARSKPVPGLISWGQARWPLFAAVALVIVIALIGTLLATRGGRSSTSRVKTPTATATERATATSTPLPQLTWVVQANPTPADLLFSVAMVSATEGWAIGEFATVVHYSNGRWQPVAIHLSDMSVHLNNVAMVSASNGWMVADSGIIAHYTTGQWNQITSPTGNTLEDVAMVSASEGWAVGDVGTILHDLNGQWTSVPSHTTNHLWGLSMVSATEGWAVGDAGIVLHDLNGQWTSVPSHTTSLLRDISMVSASEGWAVGVHGVIVHYINSQWNPVASPVSSNITLYTVEMVSASEGWAVGTNGTILRYDGNQWRKTPSPTPNTIWGVAMVSPTVGWAVGGGGTILYCSPVT